ncbi:PAS domain-containing protein [Streptomyces sp. Je 1-369]|uniref:PAS domain-containing protein n=1 Tax=Streptomyces sp. Je 1-369 TaxID=2966192 RepID=UPI002286BE14|nr:PAS domain-containing protein [Streptomyces sp. Je 1-369]WAL99980.1 PAS domain-containing protein [Streptomyces sp. Je 1-369]
MTTAPYLLLDTDFYIRGVNPAYLRATGRSREELIGAFMFDAFPDNPEDTGSTGVRNLTASLERVMRHGDPHDMGIQRYDIPEPQSPGGFRIKAWSPVNSPLTDAHGRLVGVLHHVEDITTVYESLRHASGSGALDAGNGALDAAGQPTALLRGALRALAFHQRAARAAGLAASVDLPGTGTGTGAGVGGGAGGVSGAALVRRDALWHGITHAARQSPPGSGCLAAVCDCAVRELPGADAAVITLHGNGAQDVQLAVTSLWGQQAEELQWITSSGPSLTAFATGEPVLVPLLDQPSSNWPLFTDAACRIGVGAAFAYPLSTATTTVGTLTLYHRGEGLSKPPADAEVFAQIAAAMLLADLKGDIGERVRATADHGDINAAIGVLAATQHISTNDALAWLRSTARARAMPLADFAREVLARRPPEASF